MKQQEPPEPSWANGITIKKTRDGYSWTVAVAADSNSNDDLQSAVRKAVEIEEALAKRYGE